MGPTSAPLASPALATLRTQDSAVMERSISQDIRNEREELREAAAQTLNVIVDLNLDGTVKWVSPSWTDVVGTPIESVDGIHISDLVASENKTVFTDVVESMKKDDSKSHRIKFAMQLGPLSKLRREQVPASADEAEATAEQELPHEEADLEAQGIMVYDSASGGESHVSTLACPLPMLRKPLTLPADHVDDSTLDRSPRNSNRPSGRHYRLAWLRSRSTGWLLDQAGRVGRRRCRATRPPAARSLSNMRASYSTMVVREAHRPVSARTQS